MVLRRRFPRTNAGTMALGVGAGVAIGLLSLAAASPASAQHYTVIGQPGPAVVVDTSVLDELGPPNNIGTASRADAANRFGPGVLVRTARPAPTGAGAAKVPPSRLIAVPSLPGRPAPQLGRGSKASPSGSSAPVRAAPPPLRQASVSPPSAPPTPVATPAAAPPPPARVAAPPPPAPLPPPAPPPAPAMQQAASAPPPAPVPTPPTPPAPPVPAAIPAAATTPTPAVVPATVTTPAAPASQIAALPAATSSAATSSATAAGSGRLSFDGGSAALSDGARQELDRLATTLAGNEAQRLQVVAYAASQGSNTSAARRLSLSRALAVRSYLIDKGIRSTRIDVRAMGTPEGASAAAGAGPADRVDLVLVSQ